MPDTGVHTQLEEFFDLIWGDEEGLAYLLTGRRDKDSRLTDTEQHFFRWPTQKSLIIQTIQARKAQYEIFYSPSLYHKAEASKEAVKHARVFWLELDGNPPDDLRGLPEPTIKIRSSVDGHEHWYWRLEQPVELDVIERVNRSMTYLFKADQSGWDATQVLRPPDTFNHKREKVVELLTSSSTSLPVGLFDSLPEPPPLPTIPVPETLPPVEEVVFKYQFPESVTKLFREGAARGQRSTALMNLGYLLAELNLQNDEILAMLMNADERWGKFRGRADRMKRLMEIVTIARQKYPYRATAEDRPSVTMLGFKTLLKTEVQIDWAWNGYLQEGGAFLLTGPPGVGKTQFSLHIAQHLALGRDVLGRKVKKPRKLAFFSLEMSLVEVKEFLLLQGEKWTSEEQDVLEKNFLTYPSGEPLYLNRPEIQKDLAEFIGDYEIEGVIIDSLGSTVEGELGSEKDARELMDWQDRTRQRTGAFIWWVHHHRKATGENKRPNKLSDVYGSYLYGARATSVFCLWETPTPNAIEVIPLKVRLTKKPDRFYVTRDNSLHFSQASNIVGSGLTSPSQTPPSDSASSIVDKIKREGGVVGDDGSISI